jgi:hypothetical protein
MKGHKVKENVALNWIQMPSAVSKRNRFFYFKRDQPNGTYKHDNESSGTNSVGSVLNYLRPT